MPDDTSATHKSSRWLMSVVGFLLGRGDRRRRHSDSWSAVAAIGPRPGWKPQRRCGEKNRISNYDISITVSGRQPGVYAVQVQQGVAMAATLDGRDLKRPRTFGTWSVDGMFETILRDLENHELHGHLLLGAEFDSTHGFPTRYERIEMQTGVHDALHWEVTRFVTP